MSCGGREDEADGGLCARGTVAPPEVALKLHLAKAVFYNRYNLGASPREVEGGTRDEGGQASARGQPDQAWHPGRNAREGKHQSQNWIADVRVRCSCV